MFSAAVDSNRSAPRPAQSPTLSPTRSAITPALRGSSSGMPFSTLPDEVRADVGGLGVDTAAELGEQGHERGAEAEADDEERRVGDGHFADEGRVQREDAPHAEQRQGDHEEAGDGPAAHRDLDRLDEAALRGRRRAHVRLDRDVHADDARRHRAQRADEEGEGGHEADGQAGHRRHVGDLRGLDHGDDDRR